MIYAVVFGNEVMAPELLKSILNDYASRGYRLHTYVSRPGVERLVFEQVGGFEQPATHGMLRSVELEQASRKPSAKKGGIK